MRNSPAFPVDDSFQFIGAIINGLVDAQQESPIDSTRNQSVIFR